MTDERAPSVREALAELRGKIESMVGLSKLPELQRAWCDFTDTLDARAALATAPAGEPPNALAKRLMEHARDALVLGPDTTAVSAEWARQMSSDMQAAAVRLSAPPKDGEVAGLIERLRGAYSTVFERSLAREAADALARLSAPVPERTHHKNFLREETSEWTTTKNDNEVTCHTRVVEGVLCRWWGDDPPPKGEALIDAAAAPVPARELSDDAIISAVYAADNETNGITRVSEMTPEGWKATTIFDGDKGLLAFARLIVTPPPAADK